jgi:DNA ligase (NAD+)
LSGWKDKSVSNLRNGIEASKKQPLHRVVYGLGVRFIGETTAKKLAEQIHDIGELQDWTFEQLMSMEDIGPKVAASIHEFFHNHANLDMIEELRSLGVNLTQEKKKEILHRELAGKHFYLQVP